MNEREKDQIKAERGRIIKKRVEDSKLVDPIVRVRFQNIEDPPAPGRPSPPLSFAFENYIFKESRNETEPDTALRHGNEYDLPLSVVNHLNDLKIPVYGHVIDPLTKALKTVVAGQQNRFACVQINMGNFKQVDSPGDVQLRRGRPKQETKEPAHEAA